MEIVIFRRRYTRWGVDGYMKINNEKFCATTEHPLFLLPQGKYKISLLYNPRMRKKMPTILRYHKKIGKFERRPFKYFSAFPLIMEGNGPLGLKYGSIVVGIPVYSGLISHTEEYFTRLYDRIRRCNRKNEEVVLYIDDYREEVLTSNKENLFRSDKNKQIPKEEKEMRTIKEIIIHCSATQEGKDYTVADIDRWHRARGFKKVGYHFVIYRNGDIHVGRSLSEIGAHCKGHNAISIGICYIGGLSKDGKPKDTRTIEQKAALQALIDQLMEEYPEATIHGHNEFSAKACPCFDVKKEHSQYIDKGSGE